MAKSTATKAKLTLNEQHDYITLRTPNGNFTTSRYGAKGSGRAMEVMHILDKFVQTEVKKPGATYGSVMRMLTNEEVLSSLWPDWDKVHTLDITNEDIGKTVTLNEKLFLKKYPTPGILREIKKKYGYIEFPGSNARVGFELRFIVKC